MKPTYQDQIVEILASLATGIARIENHTSDKNSFVLIIEAQDAINALNAETLPPKQTYVPGNPLLGQLAERTLQAVEAHNERVDDLRQRFGLL